MTIYKKDGAKSEFSKLLLKYFDAEDCVLLGDKILNKNNDEIIGYLTQAVYTGKDLIIQAKLLTGDDNGKPVAEEHTIIVDKNTLMALKDGQ